MAAGRDNFSWGHRFRADAANVQPANAGNYSVVVTQSYRLSDSSNAC